MRTAPAQPMHDTDQESSWCRGTVWSLASKAKTDWWKTTKQRSTKTPGRNIVKGQTLAQVFCINNSFRKWYTVDLNNETSLLKAWCVLYGPTRQNEAHWCWLEEEEDLFTERHRDAYSPHHHQEQAEEGQHGCCYIQICTQRERTALFLWISQILFLDNNKHSRFTGIYGLVCCSQPG